MKKLLLPLFLICSTLFAEDPPTVGTVLESLTTASGRTYTQAKITKIDGASITVMHSGGIARLQAQELPTDLVKQLGFTAEGVAAAQQAYQENMASVAAANQARATAAQEASEAAEQKAAMEAAKKKMTFKVVQVLEDGLLVAEHRRGGMAGGAASAVSSIGGGGGGGYVPPFTSSTLQFLSDMPTAGIVDDAVIDVWVVPSQKTYQYTTITGALSTVSVVAFVEKAE